jgi:hypothetical protein
MDFATLHTDNQPLPGSLPSPSEPQDFFAGIDFAQLFPNGIIATEDLGNNEYFADVPANECECAYLCF